MTYPKAASYAFARAIQILMLGCTVGFFFLMTITLGPTLESKFFPVVSGVTLEIKDLDQTSATVRFRYRKATSFRQCDYVAFAWYVGEPYKDFERVGLTWLRLPGEESIEKSENTRPAGWQWSRYFKVTIAPELRRYPTFAIARHACSCTPWYTETVLGPFSPFWPKSEVPVSRGSEISEFRRPGSVLRMTASHAELRAPYKY